MLTNAQEKLIRSLHAKKGRQKHGKCLVEGSKLIEAADGAVEFTFTSKDSKQFDKLVTTETPQDVAAVARIPEFSIEDILEFPTVLILDGVQDPGNVGAILRLCLGFNAGLILIESADPTSPKTVRSSAGAVFSTPWVTLSPEEAQEIVAEHPRSVYRLEKRKQARPIDALVSKDHIYLIAGSEGSGIRLPTTGTSVAIEHDDRLESVNVGNAVAIGLFLRSRS